MYPPVISHQQVELLHFFHLHSYRKIQLEIPLIKSLQNGQALFIYKKNGVLLTVRYLCLALHFLCVEFSLGVYGYGELKELMSHGSNGDFSALILHELCCEHYLEETRNKCT